MLLSLFQYLCAGHMSWLSFFSVKRLSLLFSVATGRIFRLFCFSFPYLFIASVGCELSFLIYHLSPLISPSLHYHLRHQYSSFPIFFVRFSFTLKFRGRPPPSFFPGHKTMATFARMCTIFLLFSPLPPCSFFPRPCHACSFLYFSATVIGYKNASRLICLPPETPPAAGRSVIRLICRGPPRDLFVVA